MGRGTPNSPELENVCALQEITSRSIEGEHTYIVSASPRSSERQNTRPWNRSLPATMHHAPSVKPDRVCQSNIPVFEPFLEDLEDREPGFDVMLNCEGECCVR